MWAFSGVTILPNRVKSLPIACLPAGPSEIRDASTERWSHGGR